jgi:hypothetical protein
MNDIISFSEMEKMAAAIGKGGMFGKTADQLLPLMLIAQAQGRHPATVAMDYDVIQGRPAINSRATLARFQLAGGRIEWISSGPTECTAVFSHPQGGSITIQWTFERATKAGLTGKQTWKQYPDQMLRARCIAEGVRATFPACLDGLYTVEEVQDFGPAKRDNVGWKREPVQTDVVVEDYVAADDPQQISTAVNTMRVGLMEAGIEWTDFEAYLRAKGKLANDVSMTKLDDSIAQKIVEKFGATIESFNKWSDSHAN